MRKRGPEVLPNAVSRPAPGESFPLPARLIDVHNHGKDGDEGTARIIELMDAHHIQWNLLLGLQAESRANNAAVLKAVRQHPDRLVGGAYADPRDGQAAIDEITRYHGEGFRVVKLFPNYGYFPDDEAVRPFFDAVAALGMAVLSHCGWLAPKAGRDYASYYSHPGRFEKLIRLYPDTVFIMAHMGGIAGFLESIMLTTRTPNTYVDCSPGQGMWVLETAGPMAATIPPDKLIWGCDSYNYEGLIPRYHNALQAIGFGPHLQAIFHDNARGVLEKIGAIPARES